MHLAYLPGYRSHLGTSHSPTYVLPCSSLLVLLHIYKKYICRNMKKNLFGPYHAFFPFFPLFFGGGGGEGGVLRTVLKLTL